MPSVAPTVGAALAVGLVVVVGLAVTAALCVVLGASVGEALALSGWHEVRSMVLVVPAGQGRQAAAPGALIKYPASQGAQSAAEAAAAKGFAVPGPQRLQASALDQVPGGQGGPQEDEPGGVSRPGAQLVQAEAWAWAKEPTSHSIASTPSAQKKPAGQGEHRLYVTSEVRYASRGDEK